MAISMPRFGSSSERRGTALFGVTVACYAVLRLWYSLVVNGHALFGDAINASWCAETIANVSMVTRLLVDCTVLSLAERIGRLHARAASIPICTVALLFSTLLIVSAAHGWTGGATSFFVGAVLCGVSWELMALMWTEAFVGFDDNAVEKLILGKISIDAVLYALLLTSFELVLTVSLLAPFATGLGLYIARRPGEEIAAPVVNRWHAIDGHCAFVVCVGGAVLFLGFNIASGGVFVSLPTETVCGLTAGTFVTLIGRWVTFALMAILVRFARDAHYELYFQASVVVSIAGFLILPLGSGTGVIAFHVCMIVSAFVAENAIILATVSLARYSVQPPLKILAAGRVVLRAGAVAGILLSSTFGKLSDALGEIEVRNCMTALVVLLIVVSGMRCLSEGHFSELFWGRGIRERKEADHSAGEQKADGSGESAENARTYSHPTAGFYPETYAAFSMQSPSDTLLALSDEMAERYSLSNRETEVLALLLDGRSVPYIKETLHVSIDTAKTHVRHIYQKTGVHSRQDLIALSQR